MDTNWRAGRAEGSAYASVEQIWPAPGFTSDSSLVPATAGLIVCVQVLQAVGNPNCGTSSETYAEFWARNSQEAMERWTAVWNQTLYSDDETQRKNAKRQAMSKANWQTLLAPFFIKTARSVPTTLHSTSEHRHLRHSDDRWCWWTITKDDD